MKKGLIITNALVGKGGAENIILNYLNHADLFSNLSFNIITLNDSFHIDTSWLKEKHTPIIIPQLKLKILNKYFLYRKLKNYLKINHYNYILCINDKYIPIIRKISQSLKQPVTILYWTHNSFLDYTKKKLDRIKIADGILCISHSIANVLSQNGLPKDKIKVIHNPLIKPAAETIHCHQSHHYVWLGRIEFERGKRVKDVIDAFELLPDDYRLTIIGTGNDDQLLIDYINHLNIEHKINFINQWIAEPWSLIKQCSALILTSDSEGLSLVVLEALSLGIPCIVSDCQGPRDFVQHAKNGYIYPIGDIQKLCEFIYKVENTDQLLSSTEIKKTVESLYMTEFYPRLEKILQSF